MRSPTTPKTTTSLLRWNRAPGGRHRRRPDHHVGPAAEVAAGLDPAAGRRSACASERADPAMDRAATGRGRDGDCGRPPGTSGAPRTRRVLRQEGILSPKPTRVIIQPPPTCLTTSANTRLDARHMSPRFSPPRVVLYISRTKYVHTANRSTTHFAHRHTARWSVQLLSRGLGGIRCCRPR